MVYDDVILLLHIVYNAYTFIYHNNMYIDLLHNYIVVFWYQEDVKDETCKVLKCNYICIKFSQIMTLNIKYILLSLWMQVKCLPICSATLSSLNYETS